ncbi:MAG TPA: enediyne biosynthesis protein UnbU [Thermoanaerobaculia bacterium]|jgi:Na+-translocating ferredoxin:NAD+ oxidoreductase RnfD subunit|nr:enediyne biosynthesis protein UnbU [Thermoanaerobaculia bacterium]
MGAHKDIRLAALRRFAAAITLLNVVGHTLLGFEQSWLTPFVGVLAAYLTEIVLELLESWRSGRRPRFLGKGMAAIDFLLPAHISGLAVSMLLFANRRLQAVVFAAVVAIASKYLFRVEVDGRPRHVFNPSNLGISATLLALPWVGMVQPYMFTEKLSGGWDWFLPVLIVCTGSLLNGRLTKKLPLVAGWVGGFAAQAVVRHFLFGNQLLASLNPMTGVAFLLFTFYMITDPATTPSSPRGQVAFGAAVAATYAAFMALHLVFGIFLALSLVCLGRGVLLQAHELVAQRARLAISVPATAESTTA